MEVIDFNQQLQYILYKGLYIQKDAYLYFSNGNEAGATKTKAMSNYIFLTKNYNEGPTTYYAISKDRIETLNESDTYSDYGQQVSPTDAGDYLYLNTNKAVEVANRCANKYEEYEEVPADYSVGDNISAYDQRGLYDDIICAYKGGELTDSDTQINKSTVEGFNFWNGHNWQTIVTKTNNGEPTHLIVDNEELIKELQAAIENKEFEKDGFGKKIYAYDGYYVVDSLFQGTWAAFEIFSSAETELNEL